jgi:hypothetical protein
LAITSLTTLPIAARPARVAREWEIVWNAGLARAVGFDWAARVRCDGRRAGAGRHPDQAPHNIARLNVLQLAVAQDTGLLRQPPSQPLDGLRCAILLRESQNGAAKHDKHYDASACPLLDHDEYAGAEDENDDQWACELAVQEAPYRGDLAV